MLILFYSADCSIQFGICWYGAGVRIMLIMFYSAGCSKQFGICWYGAGVRIMLISLFSAGLLQTVWYLSVWCWSEDNADLVLQCRLFQTVWYLLVWCRSEDNADLVLAWQTVLNSIRVRRKVLPLFTLLPAILDTLENKASPPHPSSQTLHTVDII